MSINSFVAFDLETTGFCPPCKIIEIGAVKFINGEKVGSYQSFVNPEEKLPYNIIGLTGINDSMVKNAKTIDTILPNFLDFIEDYPLIAHNASFDMKFLKHYGWQLGFNINNDVYDTLKLCRQCYPELSCHKLQFVAQYIGACQESEHRALDDAMAAALIYLDCISK